jgi:hypothetical protein
VCVDGCDEAHRTGGARPAPTSSKPRRNGWARARARRRWRDRPARPSALA